MTAITQLTKATNTPSLLVQVAGWFVGQQDRRIIRQRAGNGRALLLPTRQRGRQFVRLLANPDTIQELQRS